MRIVALSVLLGVAAYSANAESPLQSDSNRQNPSSQNHSGELDPVVTGAPGGIQDLKEWEMRRLKYLGCPTCFTTQPFPGQE